MQQQQSINLSVYIMYGPYQYIIYSNSNLSIYQYILCTYVYVLPQDEEAAAETPVYHIET